MILELFLGFALVTSVGVLAYHLRLSRRYKKQLATLALESEITTAELDRLRVFRKVVDTSPQLFLLVDQGLQTIVANKKATSFGWKKNHGFMETSISETSKLHFELEIQRVLQTGRATEGEIRLSRSENGRWSFFLYHIFPVRDDQNQVVAVGITGLDITAQREAEDNLHREREFFESILNAIPDPIYVKNEKLDWLYGNRAFSEFVGLKSADYLGLKQLPGWSMNDCFGELLDRSILRSGAWDESEDVLVNSSGRKHTVLTKKTPFVFQDGRKVLISILRDISERKTLEAQLQISQARQMEASRLATLGESVSGIAHEINNPLNVLVGIAELMQILIEKDGQIQDEKLRDFSERIVKYSMRIAKIVHGLQAISRDASSDPFADVDLRQIVEEALELCQQQFGKRGIQIQFQSPEKNLKILGRFAQISQIIMNLFNNARDAVEGQEEATIHIEILESNDFGILRIWDSGPGVPKEIEDRIMNPFFTTKPVGKGTGLGLSISRAIAAEHGGTLRLNRDVADSCFELVLPIAKENAESSDQAA